MLIDDSPDRWINNLGPSRSFAILSHSDGTSNVSDSEVESATPRSVERPKSSQPPRREVSWLNLGANSQSLESIAHHFQDYIDCFLSSSTLRRVRASDDLSTHTCPGYIWEEITLTSEVSKSAIVSHASADPGERCSFCGDLVVLRDINFERDFGQWFDPDEEEGLQSPRDLEEDDFDFEWFNLDKAEGMQRPWDQEEQDRDFERDFGQWFNSDKANGMQRPKDRNLKGILANRSTQIRSRECRGLKIGILKGILANGSTRMRTAAGASGSRKTLMCSISTFRGRFRSI